jgi:hypothetical protein
MTPSDDDPLAGPRPTTVLDRVRPTVVVRRRIFDPAEEARRLGRAAAPTEPTNALEDDERPPPSSVNVARALASLRVDELQRLERILSDDEEEGEAARQPAVPRTVKVGATITVADLARRMSLPVHELVTSLITGGFFAVTVRSSLPRETARAAATLHGWTLEEEGEQATTGTQATTPARRPRATKAASGQAKKARARPPR